MVVAEQEPSRDAEGSRDPSPAAFEGRDPSPAANEDPDFELPRRPRTAASNICEISEIEG